VLGNSENSWCHIMELAVYGFGEQAWTHPKLAEYPVTAAQHKVSAGDAFAGFSTYGLTPESPDETRILYAQFKGRPGEAVALMVCSRDLKDHRELLALPKGAIHDTIQPAWLDDTRAACTAEGKTYVVDTRAAKLIGDPIEGRMNHHPHGNRILIPMDEDGNAHGPKRGVYEVDTVTREARLIATYDALVARFATHLKEGMAALKGKLVIQHAQYSPNGEIIAVKLVVSKTQEVYSISFRRDGSDAVWFGKKPLHFQWYDNETLWGHDYDVDDGSEDDGCTKRWDRHGRLVEVLAGYGCHPGMSSDKQWFATESRYGSSPVVLWLYRTESTKAAAILMASSDISPVWKMRAHVNPSFSRDGTRVYFSKPVSSRTSQAWYADVTPFVSP